MTPDKALRRLREGNQRFTSGLRSVETMVAHLKMAELAASGQKPFAIVLTCSDSRSPAEMVFDQGVGDLFVVRVAGNIISPALLASMEFAAASFDSSLILVMGHTGCGAVKAAFASASEPHRPQASPHLEVLIGALRPAVEAAIGSGAHKSDSERLSQATVENVRRSQSLILEQSAIIRDLFHRGRLGVEGSILDLSSGEVIFLDARERAREREREREHEAALRPSLEA